MAAQELNNIKIPWEDDNIQKAYDYLDNNIDISEFLRHYYTNAETIKALIIEKYPESQDKVFKYLTTEAFVSYLQETYDITKLEDIKIIYWIRK